MTISIKIQPNTYIDSVSLMALSTKANQLAGVDQAIIAMATEMNKEVMKNVGLFTNEIAEAQTSDLIIALEAKEKQDSADLIKKIETLMTEKKEKSTSQTVENYTTIETAKKSIPEANLAVISVNGQYAAREARKSLNNDLHVMMFSDNVSVEEEIQLKALAHEKGLLMMGPDCGTAIINNIGLCFANKVRKGSIGIVGASGTGSQEISVRIHEFGEGVSQLIGTGGRDLSEAVGGRMMLDAIDALEADENTKVIVLISKPPAKAVEEKILARVRKAEKPVVIWFIGSGSRENEEGIYFEKMSKAAALKAVTLAGIDENSLDVHPLNLPLIDEVREKLTSEQKYIRGLFTGGTLCDEAMFTAKERFSDVYSNIATDQEHLLHFGDTSKAHTFIDFGADEFTNGKPHPMIDPSNRIARFKEEAADPTVGVILMDFVLGYGAHPDPVGVMVPAMKAAKEQALKEGRHLEIIGYVLGTDLDKQNIDEQVEKLTSIGATYASSSQNAGLLAREFVVKGAEQ
ncbi:acyl-CoA synthetase FdrA [Candidatus Enterococcus ikei]|uniref:Acyl-CoA synthetase FdrA n=1 Tax=Candidatus Enterococcus ikei TaxID=2815326 RepID=A0ABS3GZS9_9ENTE|nr:acyl-CoA synthetase FdrA [Enterococcus sp. DIV0869a]MBO0440761.1 acyl-CoA synthetase FdrA [Enterococcus sp. DIV0869a]